MCVHHCKQNERVQVSMKMKDATVLSQVKHSVSHFNQHFHLGAFFHSRCSTATETLRLLGDGDLHSQYFICCFFSYLGDAIW